MQLALKEARTAGDNDEVPVGAIISLGDKLIGAGGNCTISEKDPTAHAEILALRQAAQLMCNYRLPETTLYVTLEPCIMCMGALIHARVSRLVYGATDPKTGAAGSVYSIGSDNVLNHNIEITGGVLANDSSTMLKDFFKQRRYNKNSVQRQ